MDEDRSDSPKGDIEDLVVTTRRSRTEVVTALLEEQQEDQEFNSRPFLWAIWQTLEDINESFQLQNELLVNFLVDDEEDK